MVLYSKIVYHILGIFLRLDPRLCVHVYCVYVFSSLFLFFFLFSFFQVVKFDFSTHHCSHVSDFLSIEWIVVHGTHKHFIKKKILKMGPMTLFTYLKIILLPCFQFLIFRKNKLCPNKPYISSLSQQVRLYETYLQL